MNKTKYSGTLLDWGHEILKKNKFVCRYCGYDGKNDFRSWMQFSVDHVIPRHLKGSKDAPGNMVACCKSCNSITSRMSSEDIPPGTSVDDAIEIKKKRVKMRHEDYRTFWEKHVKPK